MDLPFIVQFSLITQNQIQLVVLTMDRGDLHGYSHVVSLLRALFALRGVGLVYISLVSEAFEGRNLN